MLNKIILFIFARLALPTLLITIISPLNCKAESHQGRSLIKKTRFLSQGLIEQNQIDFKGQQSIVLRSQQELLAFWKEAPKINFKKRLVLALQADTHLDYSAGWRSLTITDVALKRGQLQVKALVYISNHGPQISCTKQAARFMALPEYFIISVPRISENVNFEFSYKSGPVLQTLGASSIPLVSYSQTGGLCGWGNCAYSINIYADGYMTVDNGLVRCLAPTTLEQITKELGELNLNEILSHPPKSATCPTTYDGTKESFSILAPSGIATLDSCLSDLDVGLYPALDLVRTISAESRISFCSPGHPCLVSE